jgi:hypothetical protein
MYKQFNEFREKNNVKAGDRIIIELDQDLYTDNIIYISCDLVNCDLLKGIESKIIKVKNVEIENETYDTYGEIINPDLIKKFLNIKNSAIHLYKIRDFIRKL